MSSKRILAGILSASLVPTIALSGCNNGQGSSSADPSSTGESSSAASATESETQGTNRKSCKLLLITILSALFSLPPICWSG